MCSAQTLKRKRQEWKLACLYSLAREMAQLCFKLNAAPQSKTSAREGSQGKMRRSMALSSAVRPSTVTPRSYYCSTGRGLQAHDASGSQADERAGGRSKRPSGSSIPGERCTDPLRIPGGECAEATPLERVAVCRKSFLGHVTKSSPSVPNHCACDANRPAAQADRWEPTSLKYCACHAIEAPRVQSTYTCHEIEPQFVQSAAPATQTDRPCRPLRATSVSSLSESKVCLNGVSESECGVKSVSVS